MEKGTIWRFAVAFVCVMGAGVASADDMAEDGEVQTLREPELVAEEPLWEPREIMVDAHIGANISNYSGDYSSSIRGGVLVGFGFDFPIGHTFSINPEMNYSMMGANVDFGEGVEAKETLHYLEIPLYSKWTIGRKKVKPIVALAPVLGIGLVGRRTYDDATLLAQESETVPLFAPNQDTKPEQEEANYKKVDFGFKFKLGVQLSKGIQILAGYHLGIVSISRDEYYKWWGEQLKTDLDAPVIRNGAIFVTVGYCW